MERPILSPINSSVQDLDTPALVVDKDNTKANHESFSRTVAGNGKELVPDVSVHSSAGIALIQTDGIRETQIFCSNLPTAEIFSEHGFSNLLITLPAPNRESLSRVLNLAAASSLNVSISNSPSLDKLAFAAQESNSEIDVSLIVSDSNEHRGYAIDDELRRVVQAIRSSTGLKLVGFTIESRGTDTEKQTELLHSVDDFIGSLGNDVSGTFCIFLHSESLKISVSSAAAPIKVVAGNYIFDGANEKNNQVNSCYVITTVMSHPEKGRWYLDCGQKAISIDRGLPAIKGDSSITIERMSAEHGYVVPNVGEVLIKLGDKIRLIPANYADTFNLYDFINLASKDKLVEILKVDARGAFN